MKKSLVFIGTIALLVAMIGMTTVGNTGLDLIMSTAPLHNLLRSVIIVSLLVLGATARPRPHWLRLGIGCVSIVIMVVALVQTFNYSLQILDALIYLASATVFMSESLESEPMTKHAPAVSKFGTV